MDDLVTWLRAQWDADELEINRHPIDGMPQLYEDEPGGYFATGEQGYPCDSMLTVGKRFAMADIDAKRRILDLRDAALADADDPGINRENGITADDQLDALDAVVALLALPMVGREGYRSEWAP